MGKRELGPVSTKLPVDIYWGGELHEGVVKNLSRDGMCIDADTCPPSGSDIEVVLILGDEAFKLPGKVHRTLSKNESSGIMSVELSNPSEGYLRFVSVIQDYAYSRPSLQRSRRMHEKVAS